MLLFLATIFLISACGYQTLVPAAAALKMAEGVVPNIKEQSIDEIAENYAVGLALAATQVPVQDVMVWIKQEGKEPVSSWIRGNSVDSILVATRSGIVIPWNGHLWLWQETVVEVPLCDCSKGTDQSEETCTPDVNTGALVSATLQDLLSDETLDVLAGESTAITDSNLASFNSNVTPIGSVGPYLFVKHEQENIFCDEDSASLEENFFVFNLETGQQFDLLNELEKEHVEKNEQTTAYNILSDGSPGGVTYSSELSIEAIEPHFGPGFLLQLFYRFGVQSTNRQNDGRTLTSYDKSVLVPSSIIPEAVVAYVVAPAAIVNASQGLGKIESGGWNMLVGTEEGVWNMLKAFVGGDQSSLDE